MKKLLKITKAIFIFFILWFVIHTVIISIDGLNDKKINADVAIVLGNKVNENGTLSERLKQRLNQSIILYNDNRIKHIIVSGGFRKEGFWEAEKCVII